MILLVHLLLFLVLLALGFLWLLMAPPLMAPHGSSFVKGALHVFFILILEWLFLFICYCSSCLSCSLVILVNLGHVVLVVIIIGLLHLSVLLLSLLDHIFLILIVLRFHRKTLPAITMCTVIDKSIMRCCFPSSCSCSSILIVLVILLILGFFSLLPCLY